MSTDARIAELIARRHPATSHLLRLFSFVDHLPVHLQQASRPCLDIAVHMADSLPDGPELTTGLSKLLEARDCFVRAAVLAAEVRA